MTRERPSLIPCLVRIVARCNLLGGWLCAWASVEAGGSRGESGVLGRAKRTGFARFRGDLMRNRCCYILAYECYKALEDRKLDTETCGKLILRNKNLGTEEYRSLLQAMINAGIGEETYGPSNVIAGTEESPNLSDAFSEIDDIVFGTLDKLLAKTGVSPPEIDILVVTVSMISSAPSSPARVINRYKMKEDISVFNLSGMGCSASALAVDFVQNLFKTYKNAFAVIVSSESLSPNWYCSKEQRHQAMLKLKHSVRIHAGSSDEAFGSCTRIEDAQVYCGFFLTKSLPRPLLKLSNKSNTSIPEAAGANLNLKSGIEHFCIHPGGRAVIDAMGRSIGAGFKCNNCVWEVIRDSEDVNVWEDCIDRYPIKSTANTSFLEKYSWVNESRHQQKV
ncbi:hypothetical protein CRYUN_Cryun09bG0091400 [Craigia yunnanensis]